MGKVWCGVDLVKCGVEWSGVGKVCVEWHE